VSLDAMDAELAGWFTNSLFADAVGRLGAYRGIDHLGALTMITEVCDWRRFGTAGAFMGFSGLVPASTRVATPPGGVNHPGRQRRCPHPAGRVRVGVSPHPECERGYSPRREQADRVPTVHPMYRWRHRARRRAWSGLRTTPDRSASETETSSKNSSQKSAPPLMRRMTRSVTPSALIGTPNQVSPRCFGTLQFVRVRHNPQSARCANELRTLAPLRIQVSPSLVARVRIPARSEPAAGSEKNCTQSSSPFSMRGRWRDLKSGGMRQHDLAADTEGHRACVSEVGQVVSRGLFEEGALVCR
jgi:hypothetical protein